MTGTVRDTRRRSSQESKHLLLTSAGDLFAERGYERTTVREIGQRAGVDPTLIARYFGSKANLYLAALRRGIGPSSNDPLDITDPDALAGLLDRVQASGPKPTFDAVIRPHKDAELQQAAIATVQRRLLGPAAATATAAGHADQQLRAEIAVAALAGIALSRTSNALGTLGQATSAEVAPVVAQLLRHLLS